MDIGSLVAQITLLTGGFDRGVNRVQSGFRQMGALAVGLNQALELVGKGFSAIEKVGDFGKTFVDAANASERYRITLEQTLGSQQQAARLFDEMTKYAARVPAEYEEIMDSAVALSGVMEGGVAEIQKWMPMIGDLAAVSRLSIEETSGQIIRMYSAGAGAADLFREKGVLAMLGFQAGVSYSAEETKRMLIAAFEDPASKFAGTAEKLSGTWDGMISMMADRWFLFRNHVMDSGGAFDAIKSNLRGLLDYLDRLEASGQIATWAQKLGTHIAEWANRTAAFIRNDLPGYVDKFWSACRKVWDLVNMDPAIYKVGLVGFLLYGPTGALAGMALARTAERIGASLGLISEGYMHISQLANSSGAELQNLLDEFEKSPAISKKKAEIAALETELSKLTDPSVNLFGSGLDAQVDELQARLKTAKSDLQSMYDEIAEAEKERLNGPQRNPKTIRIPVETVDVTPKAKSTAPVISKEAINAISDLKAQIADLRFEQQIIGLGEVDTALAEIGHSTDELRAKYQALGEDSTISALIAQIDALGLANFRASRSLEIKQMVEDINGEISQISFDKMAVGEGEFTQTIIGISKEMSALAEANKEVLASSPDLQAAFNQLENSKLAIEMERAKTAVQEMIDTAKFEGDLLGLDPDIVKAKEINAEIDKLKENFPQLGEEVEKLRGIKLGNLAKEIDTLAPKALTMTELFSQAFDGLDSTLANFFTAVADGGKMTLADLGRAFVNQLKLIAAKNTAELLMEAAKHSALAIGSLVTGDGKASGHWQAAGIATANAALMGSFIAGSGLAGMAHDGMTTIPQEGTWLLDKGERVVDAKTNEDLKSYLGNGGGRGPVSMTVNINNSDESGVRKALPAMREMILEIVNGDIVTGGATIRNIKTYA